MLVLAAIAATFVFAFFSREKEQKKLEEQRLALQKKEEIKSIISIALRENQFVVYFQPVFSKFDEIKAAEALVRIKSEDYGEVYPEEFIPIAEEMGCMIDIGRCVLQQIARFIEMHDMDELGIQYIEMNVSVSECANPDFAADFLEVLQMYHIDYKYINIQIPEIALSKNRANLVENMSALNEAGVNFSLDDYGTSQVTLAYLMTLPFQFVKIDRSVLWAATKNRNSLDVLKASINTLKDFSMKIVVEGVESRDMAELLKKLGCDYLQGYYYSKPLPYQEFEDFCLTMDKG